ncbi:MAG: hypothetical protein MJ109_04965 [Kiritimatiellae bacterium]|nr:hypothetical protein [Kiritimatiellia bacterium]
MKARRASALVMAIWIIAILSIVVVSFALEARLQAGVNVYIRERSRVNRLIDSGQVIAEMLLSSYESVPEWSKDQDEKQLFDEDRWFREKQRLKAEGHVKTAPILIDEEAPDSGVVTVEISSVNSGKTSAININNLSSDGGDSRYQERWWMIFRICDIPEELATEDEGTIKLWNRLIASWNDWRDKDDTVTAIEGEECGAESEWYKEEETDKKIEDEYKRRPRNNKIPDVKELGKIRGFYEFPEVLVGGVINPWADKEDRLTVKGISSFFGTEGGSKLNVNNCSLEALMTVPGVYKAADEDDALLDAQSVAQAILDAKKRMPEDYDVDETLEEWPFKDWEDLCRRVEDEEIGSEASEYFEFGPSQDSVFTIRISGFSGGMSKTVEATAYVKDSKVRYVEWKEQL